MGYEYLITGLEDLHEGQPMRLGYDALLQLLKEQMKPEDLPLIGVLSRTNDDPAIMALMEEDAVRDRYAETSLSEADFRTQLLYEQGMKSKNKFVCRWFEYNLNLNNVLAAAVCHKHGYDAEKVIVGDNEVAQLLRKSGVAKNANLAALMPDLKEIIAVADIQDLLERERYIDALRWNWIEDKVRFCYFEIDNVLAYFLQATILHRWDALTKEQGERIFRDMLADMKRDVHFEH